MQIYEHNLEVLNGRKLKNLVPCRKYSRRQIALVIDKGSIYYRLLGHVLNERWEHGILHLPVSEEDGLNVVMENKQYREVEERGR